MLDDEKVYRNIQQQVLKNQIDIASILDADKTLYDLGIKVVGHVSSAAGLPDVEAYIAGGGFYGDAFAVGTTTPYNYYILTRPFSTDTQPTWFNVGVFPNVGPQGPKGEQGPTGRTGSSTRWRLFTDKPTDADVLHHVVDIGDWNTQDLVYITDGQYKGNLYTIASPILSAQSKLVLQTNLLGPQGPRGIQGPPGADGSQGPQGPQGPKGDNGVSVYLYGRVDTVDDLPSPSTLNDMQAAYLVGARIPYDIYCQVGEDVQSAIWTKTGQFIAGDGTQVQVNGDGVAVWDADTKLDKNTTASYAVYGITTTGVQYLYAISSNNTPATIAYRTASGNVATGTPAQDTDAIPKLYFEQKALRLPAATPTQEELVGVGTDNMQKRVTVGDGLLLFNGVLSAPGGGGNQLYQHNLSFRFITLNDGAYASIINNSPTPFTYATLLQYLYSIYNINGKVIMSTTRSVNRYIPFNMYSSNGTTTTINYYDRTENIISSVQVYGLDNLSDKVIDLTTGEAVTQ